MAKLSVKEQDKKIQEEIKKLNAVFSDISEDKKEVAERLIERVAFMTTTLEILEDDIKRKGPTYLFEQGKQKMYVENPSQKSYNTMINRYTAACNALFNLLPKGSNDDDKEDELEKLLNRRNAK